MIEKIQKILGSTIRNCVKISHNAQASIYNCDDSIIIKESSNSTFLASEAMMLQYLKNNSNLPVPSIIKKTQNILITEFVPNNGITSQVSEYQAAEQLANLHRIHAAQYGFFKNTTIGIFKQSNKLNNSWIDFFRKERLLAFANNCFREGSLPLSIYERILHFSANLEQFLIEPESPSLIHGDIWGGNVLVHNGQIASYIDPAIYYGHREIELAFIKMFDTFGDVFFRRYHELYPIDSGFFENRLAIYNLYPYLVHVRAFGSSYLNYIDRTLARVNY